MPLRFSMPRKVKNPKSSQQRDSQEPVAYIWLSKVRMEKDNLIASLRLQNTRVSMEDSVLIK